MSKYTVLSVGLLLAAGFAATASQPAAAAFGGLAADRPEVSNGLLRLADARSYHHCHNMPRRTRCHSSQRLPVNWPPNTNTPSTSSLRERHADGAGTCAKRRRGWLSWR